MCLMRLATFTTRSICISRGTPGATSTVIYVSQFVDPLILIELEVVAVKA